MVIKFDSFAPNDVFNTIGGFKFGGMVSPYVHAHMEKNLADFNLAVERHTAKQPNLISHLIFRLYGSYYLR